jgi:hypothetical protein
MYALIDIGIVWSIDILVQFPTYGDSIPDYAATHAVDTASLSKPRNNMLL